MARRKPPRPSTPPLQPAWKLWCFRLTALVVLPVLFFAALELCLRLIGFGHPTAFLLRAESRGRPVWIPNIRFGWRFFGRNMAREPQAFSLPRPKPANTIRIFVFGESAAYGDPLPDFGLPRMLEAMLHLRYPGTHFEVVNAAMTGINSHAIRDIARDCASADGDVWVIYMGNNEVVGPFGAGTVFSQQTPSLPVIRASLALRTTRTGQLLDTLIDYLHPPPAGKSEWGGVTMFLDQVVRADDPRMARVYDNFQHNLTDIINAGRRAGAGVVVSTVAVNLKDCAPFASTFKPNLTATDHAHWQEDYDRAVQAQTASAFNDALLAYDEAAQLDDTVAELHFRRAACRLATGKTTEAQRDFAQARDLDTLRFRCDSRLNEIIRDTAAHSGVLLTDAEQVFAAHSANGIPGGDLFYEHVHLTWEGNWLLARALAEQVAKLLPAGVTNRSAKITWPTPAECAHSLAWTDRAHQDALALILGRLQDPPFTHQLNHAAQVAALKTQMDALASAGSADELKAALAAVELAIARSPDDPILQAQLAEAQRQNGNLNAALVAARRVTELLPYAPAGWAQLGLLLIESGREDEAVTAFTSALRIDPDNVWTLNSVAQVHARMGREDEALDEFRRVIALKPRFGLAHLGIGRILEARGQNAEAETHYRLAVQNRIYRAEALTTLGRFCLAKGWYEAARTNLQDALKLSPHNPAARHDLVTALTKLGRNAEAEQQRALAGPDLALMQTHFRRGVELGRAGRPAEAAVEFREVIRLMPELAEGHLNLAIALQSQGLHQEALEQFQETLALSPTNQLASERIRALRAQFPIGGAEPGK